MKKNIIILFFFVISLISTLLGQVELTGITPESLQIENYSKFPEAEAIVLRSKGYLATERDRSSQFVLNHTVRMHILQESGVKYANVEIPYQSGDNFQTIEGVTATTYIWEDGQMNTYEVNPKEIFREKVSENFTLLKFTFPRAKPGAVLQYSYRLIQYSVFSFTWRFQENIPTLHSEFAFVPGKGVSHAFLFQGSHSEKLKKIGASKWSMADLPALKPVSYVTNLEDYRSKMYIQMYEYHDGYQVQEVLGTWESFTDDIYKAKRLGRINKADPQLGAIAKELTKNIRSDEEKIKVVYKHVRSKMKWNNKNRIFIDNKISKVYESGSGTRAEINLALIHMLRAVGVKCTPLLLSTRRNGIIIKAYPLINQFNVLAVYVPLVGGKYLILDVTDPLRPYDLLDPNLINGEGWVLDRENPRWVTIPKTYPSIVSRNVTLSLENGTLSGELVEMRKGYSSWEARNELQNEGEGNFAKEYILEGEILDVEFTGNQNPDTILSFRYNFQTENYFSESGAFIYIGPMLAFGWGEHPFKDAERIYPIDFTHQNRDMYTFSMKIPEGYEVESLPKNSNVIFPKKEIAFQYECKAGDGYIFINAIYDRNISYFEPHMYPALKQIYDNIIRRHGEKIVLKKVE